MKCSKCLLLFLFQKRAVGAVLFERVCESLDLIEKDYFGLSYIDPTGLKVRFGHSMLTAGCNSYSAVIQLP